MKTILISVSKFGTPVSDYYRYLGAQFVKHKYSVVYIFDGRFTDYPEETASVRYYTWPNRRPTKLSDFMFAYRVLKKEKPILCVSNFGSTNVMTIMSFLLGVKQRINYIHTTSKALLADSDRHKLRQEFLRVRKKMVYSLNTHFITNSEGAKWDSVNYYGIPENKITVLPILIPKSQKQYKSYGNRENCICIVGRLHPVKGHERLINAFKACTKKWPGMKLKIVGDGPLKAYLMALTTTLKLENNVEFTGNIPNHKINEVFSSSLISVSASIDEAYGLVNVEACREGTPLLSTRTAGAQSIIEEHRNGLFFDFKEPYSLCYGIETILTEWQSYSENALKSFKKHYSLDAIHEHFKKIKAFA